MNTGIQDVHNLAWKLRLVRDGSIIWSGRLGTRKLSMSGNACPRKTP